MCCQSFIYESETFVPSQVQARSHSLSQVSSLCWPGQGLGRGLGWVRSRGGTHQIYPASLHWHCTHLELWICVCRDDEDQCQKFLDKCNVCPHWGLSLPHSPLHLASLPSLAQNSIISKPPHGNNQPINTRTNPLSPLSYRGIALVCRNCLRGEEWGGYFWDISVFLFI